MAVLLISGILGLLPLLGIAYIVLNSNGITVDGLFMSLILLTMSGIFFLNIALELLGRRKADDAASPAGSGSHIVSAVPGTQTENGTVEAVAFFETEVGRPDKSLVTLRPHNGGPGKTLVFNGDLRNALPAGKRIKLTYTAGAEGNRLLGVGD
ncbi:MAG TPA: hypothetical protein VMT05_07555 [Terriglobales bacterium]|jgi:hypothetical protein|nr:hypothetical protein [Terriglobales bacterium]